MTGVGEAGAGAEVAATWMSRLGTASPFELADRRRPRPLALKSDAKSLQRATVGVRWA
ncbi:MAG: hypothetical protein H0V77_06380 [Actinobacteria bacterium]|nr:hypothetical protein [Actinomycetota bacterium]